MIINSTTSVTFNPSFYSANQSMKESSVQNDDVAKQEQINTNIATRDRLELRIGDFSKGTPGISQSSVRTVEFTAKLCKAMNTDLSIGMNLEKNLNNLANAYNVVLAEITANSPGNSQKHTKFLDDAMLMLTNFLIEQNAQMLNRPILELTPWVSTANIDRTAINQYVASNAAYSASKD